MARVVVILDYPTDLIIEHGVDDVRMTIAASLHEVYPGDGTSPITFHADDVEVVVDAV